MELLEKIKQSTQLSPNQKVLLLANFDKIPDEEKKKLAYLLDEENKIDEERIQDIKTAGKKTVKSLNNFLEKHDG